jgi:putative membrane protein
MNQLIELNISYWGLQTVAMLITAFLIPKLRITSVFGALLIVLALAFINSKVWDAALFLSIPEKLTYQTILLFLTNGLLFWLLVKILPGIEVDGILPALIAPIIFSVSSIFISNYAQHINWPEAYNSSVEILSNIKQYLSQVKPSIDTRHSD